MQALDRAQRVCRAHGVTFSKTIDHVVASTSRNARNASESDIETVHTVGTSPLNLESVDPRSMTPSPRLRVPSLSMSFPQCVVARGRSALGPNFPEASSKTSVVRMPRPSYFSCHPLKIYQEMDDHEAVAKTMEDYLEDHNAMTSKPMSLVLFQNAVEHVARVSRIIGQPMGNALLVGVGGSGRKSLTILAVSIADFKLFQIEISKSYGMVEWRDDLKKVFTMVGADNR